MAERTVTRMSPEPGEHIVRSAAFRARRARRLVWAAATALFAISLPLLLITGNVRFIINSTQLYEWDFNRYDIESRIGLPRAELRSAARQIVDYFNDDTEFLDVRVKLDGEEVSLFRSREVLHMRDVKGLVRGVYATQLWTLAYVAAFVAAGFLLRRRLFLPLLKRGVVYSGIGTAVVVAGLGLASLISFDAVFTQFHLISFANNLWQLNPYRDYLLIIFPQGFFLDATLAIAAFTIVEFTAIAAGVWWFAKRGLPAVTRHADPE